MQREKPAACLVDAFSDEVGGIDFTLVKVLLVLEGIVYLRIRHRTRIKPYVDQVRLALHGQTALRHEDDVIHVGTVEVDFIIVFFRIDSRHESAVLIRVGLHETGSY